MKNKTIEYLCYSLMAVCIASIAIHFLFVGPALDEELKVVATTTVESRVAELMKPQIVFADQTMESKVEDLKNSILDRLAQCESGGKKEEDGITILDTNGVGSYGVFQFQKKTVMHYYQKKTGQPINGRDAIILAMTPDKARELAEYVVFASGVGVEQDWYNCSKKHGLQAEVNVINKLTK
jgi:hypothetical protein